MIKQGNILDIAFLAIAFVIIYVQIRRAGKKLPTIRRMAALDAIEEVVGRATETRRPILFTQGMGGGDTLYSSEGGPQIVAGLSVLSYVSRLAAKYNAKLICTVGYADVYLPTIETVRSGFLAEGHPEAFREEDIRYVGATQGSYASSNMDLIRSEQVAGTVIIGPLWAESLMMLFNAADIGAIQVAGTSYTHQMPFVAAVADYSLIGEEIFAAGAYISKDPGLLGSIFGEDIVKTISIALTIIAVIAATVGATAFLDIIKM